MLRELGTEFGTKLLENKGLSEGAEDDAASMEANMVPPATFSVMPHQGGGLYTTKTNTVVSECKQINHS